MDQASLVSMCAFLVSKFSVLLHSQSLRCNIFIFVRYNNVRVITTVTDYNENILYQTFFIHVVLFITRFTSFYVNFRPAGEDKDNFLVLF